MTNINFKRTKKNLENHQADNPLTSLPRKLTGVREESAGELRTARCETRERRIIFALVTSRMRPKTRLIAPGSFEVPRLLTTYPSPRSQFFPK